jgi:aminoglycoside phosphotransferase (APT) family kinase protein
MLDLLRARILPQLRTPEARDSAEHIERTLALLCVEATWPAAMTESYADRAGLERPAPDLHPAEALARLRAMAASRGQGAVAAEAWLQPRIAERRDASGGTASAVTVPDLSGSDIRARLTPYLREKLGAPDLLVESVEPIPGGRSKQTFRLGIAGGGSLPAQCVLRVDRKAALVPTRAIEEFQLLAALWNMGGVAVPEPLLGEDGDVLGGSFVIVGLAEGAKAGEYFPEIYGLPDDAAAICVDLARILGRLHGADVGSLPIKLRCLETAAVFGEQIDADYRRARAGGLRAAEFEAAYQWLRDNLASAAGRARLCHGDVGLHNLLVRDGRVTALLDWELAVAGPAAFDLASTRHVVELVLPWPRFVEEYLAAGGAPEAVEPRHLEFYTVLRRFRINVASHGAAAMFRDGVSDDFVLANAGYDMHVRARALLARTMAGLGSATGTGRV